MPATAPTVLYRERLAPGIGLWIGCLGVGLASFLVGAPINITAGIVAGIVMFLLVGGILYGSSPTIEITETTVRFGRARIERDYVGRAYAFRGEDARLATGPALDGRAYMCFRGWITSVIRIQITDPADPTPYWIASSRNPEKIAAILNEGLPEED
ncbi:DUF3093 domain-containing protein [Rothia sp. SD9660Na]|uniref:DUF3093 domain-containing protein n=1 Tax=Rothia sp. SD9660Na TaxID=3047030 RepID=UPI0024BA2A2E|nr:DUF3093 domain-containing protein [Rothia sp. SD9660Na]WHS49697.1 DUF3093 domain-containing protein [Rothia sp. SD9660Na]